MKYRIFPRGALFTLLFLLCMQQVRGQAKTESAVLPLEVTIIDRADEKNVPEASIIIYRLTGPRDSVPVDTLQSNGFGNFHCFLFVEEPTIFSFSVKSPQHLRQTFKVLAGPNSGAWTSKRVFPLEPYERGELTHQRRIGFENGGLNYYPREEFESLNQELDFLKRYISRPTRGNEIERIELSSEPTREEFQSFGDSLAFRRCRKIQDYLTEQGIPGDLIIILPQDNTTQSAARGSAPAFTGTFVMMGIRYAEPESLRPKQ
ncbi:MAG: hypothetical protein H6581_20425 [Bacteroidia bacterium]|nr:hypothetical protein [Bacteroidia bacterium]